MHEISKSHKVRESFLDSSHDILKVLRVQSSEMRRHALSVCEDAAGGVHAKFIYLCFLVLGSCVVELLYLSERLIISCEVHGPITWFFNRRPRIIVACGSLVVNLE